MDNKSQCDPSSRLKPTVMTVVITHGITLSIPLALLWFVVPVFGEMFADFGASLPGPTQFLLDVSCHTTKYFPITIMLLAALLFGDAHIYLWLYQTINRKAGLLWFWGLFIALFLQIPLVVMSTFLPIFKMVQVVS